MSFISVNGQSLNGKWLLKDIDSGNGIKGYPGFQLLEINNSEAEFFTDFSLEKVAPNLKVIENEIVTSDNIRFARFKIVDENNLKLYIDGKSNDNETTFICNFYRLMPTITILTKQEIEKLTFSIIENDEVETEFSFNKEIMKEELLKLLKRSEGHKMQIEQIDSTFFITNYLLGSKSSSFPIKEVTTEFLTLYNIPTEPTEITAYRKQ